MNEQIKLPDQEWLGYDPERGDMHGYTFDQMREFTQLIVKECMELSTIHVKDTESLMEFDAGIVEGYRRAKENMKEYFGVEE